LFLWGPPSLFVWPRFCVASSNSMHGAACSGCCTRLGGGHCTRGPRLVLIASTRGEARWPWRCWRWYGGGGQMCGAGSRRMELAGFPTAISCRGSYSYVHIGIFAVMVVRRPTEENAGGYSHQPRDYVGLLSLIVGVGALQIISTRAMKWSGSRRIHRHWRG